MSAPLQRRKALSKRPRKWTPGEERRLLTMLRNGKGDLPALREAFNGRKDASIRSKVRKFRVKHDLFGDAYREEKIKFSEKIVRATNPKTVFEAYAGAGHQTLIWAKKAEAKAICAALGEHAKRPAVSATKSMTGHLLGAAGGGWRRCLRFWRLRRTWFRRPLIWTIRIRNAP